jgi:hypothetical protein
LNVSDERLVVRHELLITVLMKVQDCDVTPCGWINSDVSEEVAACILRVYTAGRWGSKLP